jgi:hypothetical protein
LYGWSARRIILLQGTSGYTVMMGTPEPLFTMAGGPNELMAGTHYYSTTGIVARGRI